MKKIFAVIAALLLGVNLSLAGDKKKEACSYSYREGREHIIEEGNMHTNREIKIMVSRVNEIYQMDKSSLTSSERKQMRQETKEIKKELQKDRGVTLYLSFGAIIIIILLLIILL